MKPQPDHFLDRTRFTVFRHRLSQLGSMKAHSARQVVRLWYSNVICDEWALSELFKCPDIRSKLRAELLEFPEQ